MLFVCVYVCVCMRARPRVFCVCASEHARTIDDRVVVVVDLEGYLCQLCGSVERRGPQIGARTLSWIRGSGAIGHNQGNCACRSQQLSVAHNQ